MVLQGRFEGLYSVSYASSNVVATQGGGDLVVQGDVLVAKCCKTLNP